MDLLLMKIRTFLGTEIFENLMIDNLNLHLFTKEIW